jgi:hypothetical protein
LELLAKSADHSRACGLGLECQRRKFHPQHRVEQRSGHEESLARDPPSLSRP